MIHSCRILAIVISTLWASHPARQVVAEDAVALRLAGETVDDDKLAARLEEYCQSLCAWSPITNAGDWRTFSGSLVAR